MEDEPAEEFTFSHGPGGNSSGVEPDKSSDSGGDVPVMARATRGTKSSKANKKVSKRALYGYPYVYSNIATTVYCIQVHPVDKWRT